MPAWIQALAAAYLILPLLTLIQLGFKVHFSLPLLGRILTSEYFMSELVCSVTAAAAVYLVTPWSFIYLICLSIYAIGMKLGSVYHFGAGEVPLETAVLLFWFTSTLLLVSSALRIPYLNPRLQWWKQPARYGIFKKGILYFKGIRFPVVTLNLSSGGVFLRLDERALGSVSLRDPGLKRIEGERRRQEPFGNLALSKDQLKETAKKLSWFPGRIGDGVRLKLPVLPEGAELFDEDHFELKAEVVWVARPESSYRYGLGLKFKGVQPRLRKKFSEYLACVERSGSKARTR